MTHSLWPDVFLVTASDLKSYVNQNREDASALLQSVATTNGKGQMVEVPRGPLLLFFTNVIGMCNIAPSQAHGQDTLEILDSVNNKLTAFHNFIRESRITCRTCGQCSDKNDPRAGFRQERNLNHLDATHQRDDISQERSPNGHVNRIQNFKCEGAHQGQGIDEEGNRMPEEHINPQSGTHQKENETQKAHVGHRERREYIGMSENSHQFEAVTRTDDINRKEGVHQDQNLDQKLDAYTEKHTDPPTGTHQKEQEDTQRAQVSHAECIGMSENVSRDPVRTLATPTTQPVVGEDLPNIQEEGYSQGKDATVQSKHADQRKQTDLALQTPHSEHVEQDGHNLTKDVDSSEKERDNQNRSGCQKNDSQDNGVGEMEDSNLNKENISMPGVGPISDVQQEEDTCMEDDESAESSVSTNDDTDSDSAESGDDEETTPDTSMSDRLEIWREGLAKSGPPENLQSTSNASCNKPVLAPSGHSSHRGRYLEVRVRILNSEIASEVRSLTKLKLKQCIERQVKKKRACIDCCTVLPSGEIRIMTTDEPSAQILRQVSGWMPGAFGGLKIQRKNSTVVVKKI
ncbi:MAG: hypothetical protein Q9178_000519 [Gyalolechia marmorata]